MTETLSQHLLDAALILFGEFHTRESSDSRQPFALQLEMLASYPAALQNAAQATAKLLQEGPRPERLLCVPEALPLATLVSQYADLPLVYLDRQGREASLVGAYDIGHPTLLITNHQAPGALHGLIQSARRVGLEVAGIVTLVGWGSSGNCEGVPVWRVLTLEEVIAAAEDQDILPRQHADLVRAWIAQADVTPRQD
ncbi:MAG: hypothetical protein IPK19_32925 [Chloroflexi bacterium]|nr:hypothetical protein [Chloroflexota bacterium]